MKHVNPNQLRPHYYKWHVPNHPKGYHPCLLDSHGNLVCVSRREYKSAGIALQRAIDIRLRWIGLYRAMTDAAVAEAQKPVVVKPETLAVEIG